MSIAYTTACACQTTCMQAASLLLLCTVMLSSYFPTPTIPTKIKYGHHICAFALLRYIPSNTCSIYIYCSDYHNEVYHRVDRVDVYILIANVDMTCVCIYGAPWCPGTMLQIRIFCLQLCISKGIHTQDTYIQLIHT
jgi:hypothetical protein